ncbi:anti-sigma factor family protein [Candidatus Formimonas warabiya]|uniref:Anti-sigma-W factor RsiW n=1 Tax=Formimonas warabiya TaxID=1761012 RepID=A0A3G1KMT5_FORW1|nr:zf-HC2 domain-containing protein [Candidatus Formimonas warabiya]ATW23778.1 hypothetical protein DCMF_02290 [Candidatus Formimonas warabiya]
MNCLDIQDLLSPYLDDVLTSEEILMVENHLEGCPSCRKDLAELKETVALIQSIPEVPLPSDFSDQIHDLLTKVHEDKNREMPLETGRKWWKKFAGPQRIFVAAAAMIIIVLSLFGSDLFQKPQQDGGQAPSIMSAQPAGEEESAASKSPAEDQDLQSESSTAERSMKSSVQKDGTQEKNIQVFTRGKVQTIIIFIVVTAAAVLVAGKAFKLFKQ